MSIPLVAHRSESDSEDDAPPAAAAPKTAKAEQTKEKPQQQQQQPPPPPPQPQPPQPKAKPKLVLPSAAALLARVPERILGTHPGARSLDPADAGEKLRLASDAPETRYNAAPPPAALAEAVPEETAWRLRPLAPASAPAARAADASASSASPPAAEAPGPMFAPPQVARRRPNVSTEDVESAAPKRRKEAASPQKP
jgi:hypothetical protein